MGKGAPIRWLENQILRRHLRGRGIEIGALWRRFPVSVGTKVWYVDRQAGAALGAHYAEVGAQLVSPDVVADAADLPFAPGSLEFVIASHVLEHLPFPLATLECWYRLLAPGGSLLLRVPDKRFTFDAKRQRTTLAHLLREHEQRGSFDKGAHFADYVEGVTDYARGTAQFSQEVRRLMDIDYSIHYHVWTTEDLRELLRHTQTAMKLAWAPVVFWGAHFYRKEIITLLQRSG